jgi:hypothetical protein
VPFGQQGLLGSAAQLAGPESAGGASRQGIKQTVGHYWHFLLQKCP